MDHIQRFIQVDIADATAAMADLRTDPAAARRALPVHVHVPKCAGTTINSLLQQSFGDGFLAAYSPVPRSSYSADDFFALTRDKPRLRAIASHSIRRFPRRLPDGRMPLYFCLLREPTDWLLSNYSYLIKNWSKLSPEARATLPTQTPDMTTRELAGYLLERAAPFRVGKSNCVAFFAEPWAEDRSAKIPLSAWSAKDALSLACHFLDSFFFVGVVEQINLGIRVLRHRLRNIGIELAECEPRRENISHDIRGDTTWMNEDDAVGRLALERVAEDIKLYDHARTLLDRAVTEA